MHISPRLLVSLPNATAGIFIGEIVTFIFLFFSAEKQSVGTFLLRACLGFHQLLKNFSFPV